MFNNIAVLTVKSRRLMDIASLSAKLFPNAVYHLIGVFPPLDSRPMPSTIYQEVMNEIVDDALEAAELTLNSLGVMAIKKVKLVGKPKKVITDYIIKNRIDLVVMTAGVTDAHSFQLSGEVSKSMLMLPGKSLLVYPSAAKKVSGEIGRVTLVATPECIDRKAVELLSYLRKIEGGFDLNIICRRPNSEECERLSAELKGSFPSSSIVWVEGLGDFPEKYHQLSSISDLTVSCKGASMPSPDRRSGNESFIYEVKILELSRCPVLFL